MPRPYRRALCWVRRDLRLCDHAVLAEATAHASEVIVAFVFDTSILRELDRGDRRVTFIHRSLTEMDEKLRRLGSCLVVRHGEPTQEVPRLVEALNIDAVYSARDFEPSAVRRDYEVSQRVNVPFHQVLDHVIQAPEDILNQAGGPFQVFTPYSKAWRARFHAAMISERHSDLTKLCPAALLEPHISPWALEDLGFFPGDLWLEPGQDAALARLREFTPKMGGYGELRDFPALDATSGLSVHLRFGTLSIREAMRAAMSHGNATKWTSELIWREFYAMILATFPNVVEEPFQQQYHGLTWLGDQEVFAAWKQGNTGYPLVDAAMRCLNATGWMHNRLRMVVASFLTKDLLVDYRLGEAYFAKKLLDFDLASNNGGWQWAASMGVDAQPYFRIFNPILQSRKYDPDGRFIRQWCPELINFSNERVHWPKDAPLFEQMEAGCIIGDEYPAPIVDHAVQKEAFVEMLKARASSALTHAL